MTRDEIQRKASEMRVAAQMSDEYGEYHAGVNRANAWEADQLRALDGAA